jgi:FkbM family methyltransferase
MIVGYLQRFVDQVTRRHPVLTLIARVLFIIPGTKPVSRVLTRFAIQNLSLSLKNKQRLYNFFGAATAPRGSVAIKVKCAARRKINLELDLHDELSRNWYYWEYEGYERATVQLYKELLKSKFSVFDIGANIGFYTLLAASLMSRGEIHAFEAHPEVFECLQRNARLNRFRNAHMNHMAMSDKNGQVELFLPIDGDWTNASLVAGFTAQNETIAVESTRFDTYCDRNGVNRVDLVKIDVEGAELQVFHGMGRLLDAWLPDIICEVLEPYENELDEFFCYKPYRKFLIRDDGIKEVKRIKADSQFRDYYLSCSPVS